MAQLKFSGGHVWVRVEGSDAVLGLSDYLQDQIGEITALELPDIGDVIRATRRMGKVEVQDVSSPIEAPITVRSSRSTPRRWRTPTWSTAIRIPTAGCCAFASKTRASSRS